MVDYLEIEEYLQDAFFSSKLILLQVYDFFQDNLLCLRITFTVNLKIEILAVLALLSRWLVQRCFIDQIDF